MKRSEELRRKTPLRSSSTLKPGKPLRPRSAKTEALYRTERTPLNRELVDDPRRCEFPLGCTEMARCWHEYHTRGQGGSYVDRANLRASCFFHNEFAEDHTFFCHDIGWRYSAKRASQLATGEAA